MAAPEPGIPPGTAGSGWPQWGVDQAGRITEAAGSAAKLRDMAKGYLTWFSSREAAESWYASQQGLLSGKIPGAGGLLSGLAAIGGFFDKLGEGNTWIRVAQVLLGVALIGIGVARLTHASNLVSRAAGVAAAAAV
ncbi:MAG TPA: hypothetical protein VGG25_10320 [Streptosporangiaceae bacterium]|jgi:hypothetical protein